MMQDMLVKLYTLPEQDTLLNKLAEENIAIRRAMAPEKHMVLPWVKARFNPGWSDECEVAFSRQPVTCLIAVQDNQILGFGCYEATKKNFFGPTGVDESCRGKGIGKALMLACMHAMAAEGYAYAIIGGAGPTEFYEKAVGAIAIPDSFPGIYGGMLR